MKKVKFLPTLKIAFEILIVVCGYIMNDSA